MSELTPPDPAYTVPMAEITALVQLPAACLHRARRPIAPNALWNCSQTATSRCRQKLAFSGPPRGISYQRVDEIRAEEGLPWHSAAIARDGLSCQHLSCPF